MSKLVKTVELATKPKRAAPKAKVILFALYPHDDWGTVSVVLLESATSNRASPGRLGSGEILSQLVAYIDPIVQATFNQDGALQDIVRTIGIRLRDPNTTVVFKALITLHTIMRSGALDPVYSYLSSSSLALTLSSHEAPNISAYGHYLAARIKSYGNLKHDVIRDKSDRRATNRLRHLAVEQGLLRETREIQRMIAALVESKFYSDDVDDDVSMTALRLLVKDLLVLFTAVNEGMINILEHYFEMSHVDATTALKIYKTFCRDTERVVGYLGIAKKLYNVLNVPIPNLKHAPVSLAGSLEEYLNDPNFEKNRQEYKENKRIADGASSKSTPAPASSAPAAATAPSTSASTPAPSSSDAEPAKAPTSFTDFFESIESAQTPMFNPSTQSPSMGYFQQQAAFNPFGGPVVPQATGMPFARPGLLPQATGMVMPNPFLQPQMTGFAPQMQVAMATGGGINPFRQSMMMTGAGPAMGGPFGNGMVPQQTGMGPSPFAIQPQATGAPFGGGPSPFGQPQQHQPFLQPQSTGFPSTSPFGVGARPMSLMPQSTGNPFQQQLQQPQSAFPTSASSPAIPNLSSSSPFAPSSSSAPPSAAPAPAPLTVQKTGARNPFAPAPGTIIPQQQQQPADQPKGPSMNDMAISAFVQRQQTGVQQQQPPAPPPQDAFSQFLAAQKTGQQPAAPLTSQKTGGLFASVASDLAFNRPLSPSTSTNNASSAPFSNGFTATSTSSSTAPISSSLASPFSSVALSSTSAPAPSPSAPFLTAQPTGYPGSLSSSVKPFQPSSSFGSQLASELGAAAPAPAPAAALQSHSTTGFGANAPLQAQSTGWQPSPQATGYSPFGGTKLPPLNTPLRAGLTAQPTGNTSSAFGASGATGSLI
ncbi:hypothetical protein JCM1841_004403 [Sporobolomyces salmonicolor]